MADILSDEVLGNILGKQMRLGRALTPKEVQAYAKANMQLEQEDEIAHAIATLEDAGYSVIPPE